MEKQCDLEKHMHRCLLFFFLERNHNNNFFFIIFAFDTLPRFYLFIYFFKFNIVLKGYIYFWNVDCPSTKTRISFFSCIFIYLNSKEFLFVLYSHKKNLYMYIFRLFNYLQVLVVIFFRQIFSFHSRKWFPWKLTKNYKLSLSSLDFNPINPFPFRPPSTYIICKFYQTRKLISAF